MGIRTALGLPRCTWPWPAHPNLALCCVQLCVVTGALHAHMRAKNEPVFPLDVFLAEALPL